MKLSQLSALTLIGASLLCGAAVAQAKGDTPETMMNTAKEALAITRAATERLADQTALVNRLASDKAYAARLLDAIQKNDAKGIVAVLQETVTKSQITVTKVVTDFHFEVSIKTSSGEGYWCFSSDRSCGGHNVVLG